MRTGLVTRRRGIAVAAGVAVLALLVAVIAIRPGGTSGSRAATSDRPNIVVLMTDDQTVEDMRALPKTQALIGAHGVTFANSFVSYSLCCPSRATYLTGQYAHNHGVLGNGPPFGGYGKFAHQETTFPVALQRAGYHTVHIGKYLNGYGHPPVRIPPGWSDWYGSIDPSTYRYFGYTLNENGRLTTFGKRAADYQTDVYARLASTLIRKQHQEKRRFFLHVSFLAPHAQVAEGSGAESPSHDPVPAPRHAGRFAGVPLPQPASYDEADVSDKPRRFQQLPPISDATRAAITRSYRARLESLLAVDDAVQQIVQTLQDTGELARTVVLFTSDNGFFFGEHRIAAGKVWAYEPSIRVPLLVRGPGVVPDVSRHALVANVDLAPTILDLAGAKPLRTMDGRSLVPLLKGGDATWNRDILLETGGFLNKYDGIRTPQYTYVEYADGERELYDLTSDPYELQNRHGDPALAAVEADLAKRLATLRTCAGASCGAR